MKHRLVVAVLTAGMAITAGACGGNPEPEEPTPAPTDQGMDPATQPTGTGVDSEAERRAAEEERIRRETMAARDILEERIHFDYDQSEIGPASEQKLLQKVAVMRANPDVQIRIEGHADERGSIEYNMALAQRRAEAARSFLMDYGVSGDRIFTVSYGEDRPLINASNEQAWAQNRRDEFTIVTGGDRLRNPSGE